MVLCLTAYVNILTFMSCKTELSFINHPFSLFIFSSCSKYSTCENECSRASNKANIWELHNSTLYEFLVVQNHGNAWNQISERLDIKFPTSFLTNLRTWSKVSKTLFMVPPPSPLFTEVVSMASQRNWARDSAEDWSSLKEVSFCSWKGSKLLWCLLYTQKKPKY